MPGFLDILKVVIPPLASLGGGALAGRDTTSTSTQKTVLTPEQQQVSNTLSTKLQGNLSREGRAPNVQPMRNQGRTAINRATGNAKTRLETDLASRGFERSGQVGSGFGQIETNRVNAIGSLEAQILQFIEEQKRDDEQRNIENALSFLPTSSGVTRVSTQGGGGVAAGAIEGGLGGLTSLFVLDLCDLVPKSLGAVSRLLAGPSGDPSEGARTNSRALCLRRAGQHRGHSRRAIPRTARTIHVRRQSWAPCLRVQLRQSLAFRYLLSSKQTPLESRLGPGWLVARSGGRTPPTDALASPARAFLAAQRSHIHM